MRRAAVVLTIVTLVASGLFALVVSQQRRLIYFPAPGPLAPAAAVLPNGRDVVLGTADGMRLDAWYFPAGTRGPAVLVCNGNGGNRAQRADLAAALNREGFSVLLFDYRGYGDNPGSPTEDGLAADARAAQTWLAQQPDIDPNRIVYYGESLGAAVAVGLAVERPPAAMVLRSPFTSLPDVGALHYPWLPVRRLLVDRYPSIERIATVQAPVLVIAGDRDDIVPASMSAQLFAEAAEPKQWLLVPGAGHNDPELLDGRQMIDAIVAFLSQGA